MALLSPSSNIWRSSIYSFSRLMPSTIESLHLHGSWAWSLYNQPLWPMKRKVCVRRSPRQLQRWRRRLRESGWPWGQPPSCSPSDYFPAGKLARDIERCLARHMPKLRVVELQMYIFEIFRKEAGEIEIELVKVIGEEEWGIVCSTSVALSVRPNYFYKPLSTFQRQP